MTIVPTRFVSLAALAALALPAVPALAGPVTSPFVEGFEGVAAPGDTPLTITTSAGATVTFVTDPFDPAGTVADSRLITPDDFESTAITGSNTGGGDFTVATDFSTVNEGDVLDIDFTGTEFGITAAASNLALWNNGYILRVKTDDFQDTGGSLELVVGNSVLDSDDFGDLTDGFDVFDVALELTGSFQPNGDLQLTGVLTDREGGDDNATVTGTVLAAELAEGDIFGAYHTAYGNNNSDIELDNIAIDVVPEPSTLAIGIAGGALLAFRRRRAG